VLFQIGKCHSLIRIDTFHLVLFWCQSLCISNVEILVALPDGEGGYPRVSELPAENGRLGDAALPVWLASTVASKGDPTDSC
jgi:hypothetical protein